MRYLYINPDPSSQARATQLGCGWMPSVPSEFASVASAPCVVLAGVGQTVVLPEQSTPQQVATAAQPILDAEATIAVAAATAQGNYQTIQTRAQTALTNNANYLGVQAPTNAQVVAQVAALTRQVNGLIRVMLNKLDTISDS